jgi:hypothetical protein
MKYKVTRKFIPPGAAITHLLIFTSPHLHIFPSSNICNKVATIYYLYRMKFRINWDAMGISATVACAIHCALLPLLLQSLPIFGFELIHNNTFEYFMIALAFCIGLYSFWHGYRKHHHSLIPASLFVIGFIFLLSKQLWPSHHWWMVILAVIFIVTAHLRNYRACRVHNHAHADDCNH